MEASLFGQVSLLVSVSAAIALAMRLLKQPLIIGYILTGVVVGPSLFDLIDSAETVSTFSSLGVSLLLFIIGLGLNPRVIRELGWVSGVTGLVQTILPTAIVAAVMMAVGYPFSVGVIIGLALTFSSTIVGLKLMTDKREQGRLYGRLTIGIMLVQDLIATIALMVLSTNTGEAVSLGGFSLLFGKALLVAVPLFLISTYMLPHLSKLVAGDQEFLFLFALAWGFGFGSLFEHAGFSLEIGSLIAGVSLAHLPYAQEMASRLRPVRDFFIVVFFIVLGTNLSLDGIVELLPLALLLSLLVFISNPLSIMLPLGLFGYTKKTAFKVGITNAQIGEFSLIFVILAHRQGLIGAELVNLVTIVALITLAVSCYMFIYNDRLFSLVDRYLKLFERKKIHYDQESASHYDIVLFGYKKGGAEFIRTFKTMDRSFVVVDYDPEVIDHLADQKINYIYGDATDFELLEEAGAQSARLIVSTVTDHQANLFLVKYINRHNPRAVLICHSDTPKEAAGLYEAGATYVMMPHYIGSEKIGSFLKKNGFKKSEFAKFRQKHLADLESHIELYS